jgi:hypothetical protein
MMGKVYVGYGYQYQRYPVPGYVDIYEEDLSRSLTYVGRLTDRVRHMPGEFDWGNAGSRRTDLARSLLWSVLGREPEQHLYEQFEQEQVANWPMQPGECWRITEREVQDWLLAREAGSKGFKHS